MVKALHLCKQLKNISDSRNIAHAHYKSDSVNGIKLGKKII